MSSVERVLPVLEPALADLGLLAEDVTVSPAGRRSVLRVAVDRDVEALELADASAPVPPLTLDEVAEATKAVSAALDDSDVMGPRAYVLEVTSPGVDRPLTLPRHFRRNVGRLVSLSLSDGTAVEGRIQAADGPAVWIAPGAGRSGGGAGADGDGDLLRLDVSQVARARVQVEFTHHSGPTQPDDHEPYDDEPDDAHDDGDDAEQED